MKKYEDIMVKCERAGGIYETRKYRYTVRHGLHTELLRIDKRLLNTTAVYTEWKTVYAIL